MATSQVSEVIQYLRRTVLLPDRAAMTDGQLLSRFLEGRDEDAFAALVQRHGPMVWGVCRRLLPNHQDAEDAFQATFLVLVRKAATVRPRDMVANWLYGVAYMTAHRGRVAAAKQRRRERQFLNMPELAVAERDLWDDLRPLLDREMTGLPDPYRVVVVLCDLEGKTRKEAARRLGLPEGTVASRLARARAMLAKRLARHGLGVSGGALAVVLAQQAAAAAVPPSVVASTIKAASLLAAGQAAVGTISVKVAALTEGVITSMFLTKLKIATAVLLAAVAAAGSGGFLYRTQAAQAGAPSATLLTVAEQNAQAQKKPKGDQESLKRAVEEAERDVKDAEAQLTNSQVRLRRLKELSGRLKQAYEAAKTQDGQGKGDTPKDARPAPQGDGAGDDDDVADVPSEDLRAGKDEHKRYFLIGPGRNTKRPDDGYGLVVILPGGPGSADFHPFVKRIYKYAIPDGYLVAQPVAIKWTDEQAIVWPTKKNPTEQMKFSTEEFVAAVIKEVAAKHKVNPKRVFTLAWSSSGPAAYAISLTDESVTGSFIAMSVFNPRFLPRLEKAKGHAYYLYHSPDDKVCPYRMAEQAAKDLETNHAKVKLMTYAGGHGWRGGLYDHIRQGIEWLEKNNAPPAKKRDQQDKEDTPKNHTARSDKEKIQRTWRLLHCEINGVDFPFALLRTNNEESRATFTGEKLTTNFIEGKGFTFKLDPASKPKAIDLHPLEDADKTLLGIYRLDGDDLTICFCKIGKQERPSAFENYWKAGSHTVLLVLKRQPDKVDKPLKDQNEVGQFLDELLKNEKIRQLFAERQNEADLEKRMRQFFDDIRNNPAFLDDLLKAQSEKDQEKLRQLIDAASAALDQGRNMERKDAKSLPE